MNKRTGNTQVQLAKMLKVDRSTISLALSDSPRVSDETKRRVRELCRRFDYRPNAAARRLQSTRASLITLVLPRLFTTISAPVVANTIRALAPLIERQGLQFSIMPSPAEDAGRIDPWDMPAVGDGVLVWGDIPPSSANRLAAQGIPCLILDPCHPGYRADHGHVLVRFQHFAAGEAMANHLLERGAERLLFVKALRDHLGHEDRWEGARTAWLRHKPVPSLLFVHQDELTDEALLSFCEAPNGAIFCADDYAAMQVYVRLMQRKIVPPRAVKLAGFDGIELGQDIGLTSVKFDSEALARVAIEMMRAMLNGERVETREIPMPLIPGRTT